LNPLNTTIHLESCSFDKLETTLVEFASLKASIFRYSSGVCGLRLANAHGNLVILPYQGQQIWSMEFAGQSLAMQSVFDEPQQTTDFLSNYGGFMLHCGLLSMGNPGPEDNHPLHGELPNAPYQRAFVRTGCDEKGAYLEAGGTYRHSIAFTCDYRAEPLVRLYEKETTVQLSLTMTNLKKTPLEYMYLAHLNFKPMDGGRLVYTAPCSAEDVEVYRELAEPFVPTPEYSAFLERVAQNPAIMNRIDPEHVLDPEILMYFNYFADHEGWAHSLHIQPDGYAGYVKHRPQQLGKVVRWIARTGSEDTLGLALPATATNKGYTKEKANGNMRVLPGGDSVRFDIEAGLLRPERAKAMEEYIVSLLIRRV